MRHTPRYLMTEPEEVKRLIRNNPWATFVSATSNGLVASHYPLLLDESAPGITVLSHFGRPDDEVHELGQHQMMVIIQGPHDYVSPGWYAPGDLVPTWNHVTAHLYGTPVILDEDENYTALCQLHRPLRGPPAAGPQPARRRGSYPPSRQGHRRPASAR